MYFSFEFHENQRTNPSGSMKRSHEYEYITFQLLQTTH